ncbi:MAG TPA: protease inhibitor I42 family protein [Gammaproteobacteria bacterium]|nr:protease inhibitor I42 family protein [Gammaproteobacteria bacterium]
MRGYLAWFLILPLFLLPLPTLALIPSYNESNTHIHLDNITHQFIIKLKSNPTTGFKWSLKQYDPHYLELVRHNFEAPNSKLMGAPGFETWLFETKQKNFTNVPIKLIYARAWEKPNSNVSEINFFVSQK